jgi:hypothetical protein
MTGISQTDIEAARDAAILCLDAARHIKVFLWFDWAVAKSSDTQAIERFGRDASRVLASLDEHRQRLEEKTPPAVRQAILEANATRQPIEWFGNRYITAHDAVLYIAKAVVAFATPGVDTDELACWEAARLRLEDVPPWSIEFADIELEAAAAIVAIRTPGPANTPKPKYQPPPCPCCGKKARVTSKQGSVRYLKCSECGRTWPSTK